MFVSHRHHRKSRTVKLSHVQSCNLLVYEQALIPAVLSHCNQSKPFQWYFHNIAALEKHILHKFVHGKPLIEEEIPQVTYKQDIKFGISNAVKSVRQYVKQVLYYQ